MLNNMSDCQQYHRGETVLIVGGVYKRRRHAKFLRYAGEHSVDVQLSDGKTKTICLKSIRKIAHPKPEEAKPDIVSQLSAEVASLAVMHDAIGKQILAISGKLSDLRLADRT